MSASTPSPPLILSKGRRQRGRAGSVINPSPPVPPPPPPNSPFTPEAISHFSSASSSLALTSSPSAASSSSSSSSSSSQPPPQNIREDGYIYLQVEIGFDRQLPAPWANGREPPGHFCLVPRPENIGRKYFLPGPHRHCEKYYASCDHRSYESFVMYNVSATHGVVTSFMVVVPLLLETRPCRTLSLIEDAIKRAFPETGNLENYSEISVRIGVEATSLRICTLRQLRRIFMGLALFGGRMVELGAFTLKAPFLETYPAEFESPEVAYGFIVHLDGCYEVGKILAFFEEGGVGGELPLGKYWQETGSLSSSGSLDLICYTTYIQHVVIRATLERCVMFLWTAMHTPAERFMAWARCGVSQLELDGFGCGNYGQINANDLEPNRGWKAEGDVVMEWEEEEEEEVTSEYLPEGEQDDNDFDEECQVTFIEDADGERAELAGPSS